MMRRRQFVRTLGLVVAAGVMPRPLWTRATSAEVAFLVVGDWGTGGKLQRTVADGMAAVAGRMRPTAIVSVGDNFYPDGVTSADDPQWQSKFERIYHHEALRLPWWAVLGNHDYRSEPNAQIAYHARQPRWNMPARYYRQDFAIDAVTTVALFGLDTQQLVTGADGWRRQLTWLDSALGTDKATWRIVVGHHPIRSYGHYGDNALLVKELRPILDKHGIDVYCCGHDHDLQLIRHPDDGFLCAVSGAGGGVRASKRGPHSLYAASHGGFMSMRFDTARMSVQVHDATGASVSTYEQRRRGS